jgi:hypothetical protein
MGESDNLSLDKARQEIDLIGEQLSDLSPLALSLNENENSQNDIVENILNIDDKSEWNEQFQELVKKLLVAQNRYIQLLEKEAEKIKKV